MINLINSIFTILVLLYKGDISISLKDTGKLTIIFKGDIKGLNFLTDILILDYNVAYFGSTYELQHNQKLEENVNRLSEEDLELLNVLDKQLNVPCC